MRTSLRPHFLLGLLVALVTFGSAQPASATDKISYNYGTGSYFYAADQSGFDGDVSGQIGSNLRILGEYTYSDFDTGISGLDATSHALFGGAGYMFRQLSRADFIVDAGGYFTSVNFDFGGNSAKFKDGGVFVAVRARVFPADRFELEPYVRYFHSLDGGSSDGVDFGLEGRYFFSKTVGVNLGVEESDFYDDTIVSLGIRFGQQRDKQTY